MRIVAEEKHSLVVEVRNRRMLVLLLPVVLLHALAVQGSVRQLFVYSHPVAGWGVVLVSLVLYSLLAYLLAGPWAAVSLHVFDGAKFQLIEEHRFLGRKQNARTLSFREIERFEYSPPENSGFCRVRTLDGRVLPLFRIRRGDDFSALRRLQGITGKPAEMVP